MQYYRKRHARINPNCIHSNLPSGVAKSQLREVLISLTHLVKPWIILVHAFVSKHVTPGHFSSHHRNDGRPKQVIH